MRLTRKSRFAVIAMLELAMFRDRGAITLATIEQRHGLSISYLEQLFARLRKRGLVIGTRGPRGGYRLARPPHSISVADVINAVEESGNTLTYRQHKAPLGPGGTSEFLWAELSSQLHEFLNSINLAQLMNQGASDLRAHRPDAPR